MKRLILICICLLLLSACDNKSKVFMPERLLTEQKMIDVMTDVQIIEADINYQKNQERDQKEEDSVEIVPKDYFKMSREYYDQLFAHYGITDSIFAQNLRYYSVHLDELNHIMDSVTQRLTREQSISSTQ